MWPVWFSTKCFISKMLWENILSKVFNFQAASRWSSWGEELLFIMKCFCNRSSQVWTRMLAMEIWKWAFPTKSRWSSMISVAPGVERYLLIYWPVQLQLARFGWFWGGRGLGGVSRYDAWWCAHIQNWQKGWKSEGKFIFQGPNLLQIFFLVMSVRN